MKLKQKIALGAVLLAALPALLASFLLWSVATDSSEEALENAAMERLLALRDAKKDQIQAYFSTIRNQVLNLAKSTTVVEALDNLGKSTDSYKQELFQPDMEMFRTSLARYYQDAFGREFQVRNNSKVDTEALLDGLDDTAVALQYHYISNNSHKLGEKDGLLDPIDGSQYGEWHSQYHSFLRDFQKRFGYYDLFLVDIDSGRIVYSVFKELDFATSLVDGPYAQSGIGEVFRKAREASTSETVALSDFSPYLPSYQDPAAFIAAPVFVDDEKTGVLILQMPIDRINTIMTHEGRWTESGLGTSGETFLLGGDKRARSLNRMLVEDKQGYLDAIRNNGENGQLVELIDVKGTNIGLQQIDTEGSREALAGNSGFRSFSDFRGRTVLSAYSPVELEGLDWAIFAEIDVDEAFAEAHALSSRLLMVVSGVALALILVATGLGIWFAKTLSRPILQLSDKISLVDRDADLTQNIDIRSQDELGDAARAFNTMLTKFRHSIQQVSEATMQLASTAEQTSAVTEQTNQAVQGQRERTAQVATAVHQMSTTVKQVAGSTNETSHATKQAREYAAHGQQAMADTITQIKQLSSEVDDASTVIQQLEKHSEEIGGVLDVINGIAEQTNLLALNASIEAARAGDQGRGFAVVADEVRNLASKTQASTNEINQMIEKLQSGSRKSVQAMEQSRELASGAVLRATRTGESLSEITESVLRIDDMATQIANASEEQSTVAESISKDVEQINTMSEQTAVGAEQTASTSTHLSRLSSELQSLVSQFRI